jgi:hypothetical protein
MWERLYAATNRSMAHSVAAWSRSCAGLSLCAPYSFPKLKSSISKTRVALRPIFGGWPRVP